MDLISGLINSTSAQLLLGLIAIIEFVIAIITLSKVNSVKKKQIEYKDIIELDDIIASIRTNTDILQQLKSRSPDTLSKDIVNRIDAILDSNLRCIGAVTKANEILFGNDAQKERGLSGEYHDAGFFNAVFFEKVVLSAKHRIVIFCKRNTRAFTLDNLNRLISLVDYQNCYIEIIGFSPKMNSILFNQMKKTIPNCPVDEELKLSQTNNRLRFQAEKAKMDKQHNFNYYEYTNYPDYQFVLVDDKLYWGVVNYPKTSMTDVFDSRPYIVIDSNSNFARYILSCKNEIVTECNENGYHY